MVNYSNKSLRLKSSERFLIARCIDPLGYPIEFSFTISYTIQVPPTFDVSHEMSNNETDVFYTQNAQEALLVYNTIVQGER